MRSNGLTAAAYAPVADLDPMLAASLLDDLKDQGVAAYTTPVTSSSAAGFDRPELRSGVRDRLYVDVAESARVRKLISEHDPGLLDDNDDLTWAQLVAGFDRPYDDSVAPWPVDEDLTPPREPDAGPSAVPTRDDDILRPSRLPFRSHLPPYRPPHDPPAPAEGRPNGDVDDDFLASTARRRGTDDDENGFVPEPPPPLPTLAPYKQVAWCGLIGGPLLLVITVITGIHLPGWAVFFCVVSFIGGFVTLVATMGDGDWGSGDGAVV